MAWDYFYTCLQTILLELPIVSYYYVQNVKAPWYKPLLVTGFANCITHPLIFFGLVSLGLPYLAGVLLAQLFVVLFEAYIHKNVGRLPWGQSLHASLLSNFFSWQISPLLTYWLYFRPVF